MLIATDTTLASPAEIIVGVGVTLTRRGSEIALHVPDGTGRRLLGRYDNVADAWQALDQLDAPVEDVGRAAA